jgi:hypothetical protein
MIEDYAISYALIRNCNGGPGEIRTPDHAASKGVSACKADVLSGAFPNRAELPAHVKESSRVSG